MLHGQTCIFVGGSITGTVSQTGGSLTLNQTKVGSDLILTGGAVSIGARTAIAGNLRANNLPGSTGPNQVCGASINGNLNYELSAAAVLIGSPQANVCGGNTIGSNINVLSNFGATTIAGNNVTLNTVDESNTGPSLVVGNTIGGNLVCSSDTSITGSGNNAGSKQGQCSGF